MSTYVIRVDAETMRRHHLRMKRIGTVALFVCITVAVLVPLISVYISILSVVALVGVVFGVDALLRARRGLAKTGDLEVVFTGKNVSARYGAEQPHVLDQPILGGQAFPDHLQLVAGVAPSPLFQIEIPMSDAERAVHLERIRQHHHVFAPDRRPVALNLAFALTIVPLIVIPVFLVVTAIGAVIRLGVVAGIFALGPKLGLAALLLGSLLGALVTIRRIRRLRQHSSRSALHGS